MSMIKMTASAWRSGLRRLSLSTRAQGPLSRALDAEIEFSRPIAVLIGACVMLEELELDSSRLQYSDEKTNRRNQLILDALGPSIHH